MWLLLFNVLYFFTVFLHIHSFIKFFFFSSDDQTKTSLSIIRSFCRVLGGTLLSLYHNRRKKSMKSPPPTKKVARSFLSARLFSFWFYSGFCSVFNERLVYSGTFRLPTLLRRSPEKINIFLFRQLRFRAYRE